MLPLMGSTPILWALLPASALADFYPKKGKITIANIAPEFGVCITPVWFGIHDGTFDTYNGGDPLVPEIVPLVEDGMSSQLSELFTSSNGSVVDGVVGSAPLCPGNTATVTFDLPPQPDRCSDQLKTGAWETVVARRWLII